MRNLRFPFFFFCCIVLFALFVPCAGAASPTADDDPVIRPGHPMHFTDTLKTEKEIRQFRRAVEIAPDTFVCDDIRTIPGMTEVRGMRFNASLDNTLETDIVQSDPSLQKKFLRIRGWTRALRPACDLRVTYRDLPDGKIYVEYDISRIRVFVYR